MSSEANTSTEIAKQAPTEQQESKPGVPKRFAPGQTVCNEKNEKGKLCNGHLKQLNTQHASEVFLRGDDVLHRCQACGALYMGPPMGHVRDPRKQSRYVERDLAAILQAAGGTLPAYDYPSPAWRGEPKPRRQPSSSQPSKLVTTATPATAHAVDSSASADAHRPAAEAQAATGHASAAPMSPTAATASPAAGAETASDLLTEASTELTPGAPRDERPKSAEAPAPVETKPKAKKGTGGFKVPPELQPKPGETMEEKIARLKLINEAAKRAAGKL